MTASLLGWLVAALACAALLRVVRERGRRREAIARACHELRGPITAVRLGLALSARLDELSAVRLRALDTELGRAALALEDLTRAGAAAGVGVGVGRERPRRRHPRAGTRARARGLELDQVALGPLLDAAILSASGRADAAGATMSGGWHGAGATIWGDRLRLAQALGNLLANAVEHGGGQIRVRGELRDGRARITVDDDGPGLPAPVAELARRPRGGRGARGRGLAIALSIAEAHAGSLASGPVRGGGRVVLELPAQRQRNNVSPSAPAPGRPWS